MLCLIFSSKEHSHQCSLRLDLNWALQNQLLFCLLQEAHTKAREAEAEQLAELQRQYATVKSEIELVKLSKDAEQSPTVTKTKTSRSKKAPQLVGPPTSRQLGQIFLVATFQMQLSPAHCSLTT